MVGVGPPLLIFNEAIGLVPEWRESFPDLVSVWSDISRPLLGALVEVISPSVLILEERIYDAVHPSEIAHAPRRVLVGGQRGEAAAWTAPPGQVHLVPSNDTHVHLMRPLVSCGSSFHFKVIPGSREGVEQALLEQNLEVDFLRPGGIEPSMAFVLGNDWGPLERYWTRMYRKQHKPSICLQESVIHLGDSSRRMEWCDYPFVQGPLSILPLHRQLVFLTGNPRYQDLRPTPGGAQKLALVNSNFTYGIYEGIRAAWIEDVVFACREAGYDYLISQHPRDRGDLRAYNRIRSDAGAVHGQLRSHAVLITRFSSLIHEAVALGRPVIYYNPHGEDMHYDFEPDGRHLHLVRDRRGMIAALQEVADLGSQAHEADSFSERYAARHFGLGDGQASRRIAESVMMIGGVGRRFQQGRAIDPLGTTVAHVKRAIAQRFMP